MSPNSKFFTVADAAVLNGYPVALTNDSINVAIVVHYPTRLVGVPSSPLSISAVLLIADYVNSILNILLVHRPVVKTEPCQKINTAIDKSVIHINTVIITLGLTNLQHVSIYSIYRFYNYSLISFPSGQMIWCCSKASRKSLHSLVTDTVSCILSNVASTMA